MKEVEEQRFSAASRFQLKRGFSPCAFDGNSPATTCGTTSILPVRRIFFQSYS